MKIYVKVFKKKDGNKCIALVANNGKRDKALTFDRYIIADFLGIKKDEIPNIDYGQYNVINVVGHLGGKE